MLRPKRFAIWVIVAIAMVVLGQVFLRFTPTSTATAAYSTLSELIVFRILALAAAIFATGVVSQEVEQKTIVYLLTRPVPRPVLILARTLAASITVSIVGILAAIGTALGTRATFGELFFRDCSALILGSFAYCALFVLVSLLINKSMVINLIFAFGYEAAVPKMPGDIYKVSINSYLMSIASHPMIAPVTSDAAPVATPAAVNTIQPGAAWLAMIGLVVLCSMFNAQWFDRNEYVPREDGD
jgi:ABC-2 type transport system permease protein